jgi:hypothetical protein
VQPVLLDKEIVGEILPVQVVLSLVLVAEVLAQRVKVPLRGLAVETVERELLTHQEQVLLVWRLHTLEVAAVLLVVVVLEPEGSEAVEPLLYIPMELLFPAERLVK